MIYVYKIYRERKSTLMEKDFIFKHGQNWKINSNLITKWTRELNRIKEGTVKEFTLYNKSVISLNHQIKKLNNPLQIRE